MLLAIGSYTILGGPGLVLARLENGALTALCESRELNDPVWVERAGVDALYAAGAAENGRDGRVASFQIQNGALRMTSSQPTGGLDACHLCLNDDRTALYCADYSSGTVSVFPLSEGRVLPRAQLINLNGALGPNARRQERNHAHQVTLRPGGRELYVCDLGADEIVVFDVLSGGLLARRDAIRCAPGTGPRHLLFDGEDAFHVAGELGGWISAYRFINGTWTCVQTLPTLPPDADPAINTAAAIRRAGDTLYVSNRGHNSIAVFAPGSGGALVPAGHIPTPGDFPRDFLPCPGGFLIANQRSGDVCLVNERGEALSALPVKAAVSVCVMEA